MKQYLRYLFQFVLKTYTVVRLYGFLLFVFIFLFDGFQCGLRDKKSANLIPMSVQFHVFLSWRREARTVLTYYEILCIYCSTNSLTDVRRTPITYKLSKL